MKRKFLDTAFPSLTSKIAIQFLHRYFLFGRLVYSAIAFGLNSLKQCNTKFKRHSKLRYWGNLAL